MRHVCQIHVAVQVQLVSVRHPLVSSPSIAGDRSTLTVRVVSGEIPGHPDVRQLDIPFDEYSGACGWPMGTVRVVHFTAQGTLVPN